MLPDFLSLPARGSKPRSSGLTHVLDPGTSVAALEPILAGVGEFIDVVKFGWGTSYIDGHVAEKVTVCRAAGVRACPGGTLFEIAVAQGRERALASWLAEQGFETIEISNGLGNMDETTRLRLIDRFSDRFVVLSEVGRKLVDVPESPESWARWAAADLDAGAGFVVAEGRASGTAGLYRADGSVRGELVDALLSAVPPDRLIFEAPRNSQQVWFIHRLGTTVNLGNIPAHDVLGVETLRLGLRAETAALSLPLSEGNVSVDGGTVGDVAVPSRHPPA